MLKRLLLIVAWMLPVGLCAQVKFGYLNYSEVLKAMPQYAEAESNLLTLQGKYDAEIQRSENEFTRKYAEFLQEQKDFPQNILVKRHKELQELMEKSISFKGEITKTLQTARAKMLEPLTNDLKNAIAAVATKYKFDYVLNTEEQAYLYINPNTGVDITNEVKTMLGIKLPAGESKTTVMPVQQIAPASVEEAPVQGSEVQPSDSIGAQQPAQPLTPRQ